jgi:hypothetical protein
VKNMAMIMALRHFLLERCQGIAGTLPRMA